MREGADHDVDTLPGKITLKRIWVSTIAFRDSEKIPVPRTTPRIT
jgi:hypothetical protein